MSAWLLGLVGDYGVWMVAAITLASCLAVPVPSSLAMLAAGGFAATGDLVLWQVATGALAGAVIGDQAGYAVGRLGGRLVPAEWRPGGGAATPAARTFARAAALVEQRGAAAVFFSRWLFSALGPYVNLAAGLMGYSWLRFTLPGILGEGVWVGLYTSVGYVFAGNLEAASDLAGSALGLAAGIGAMVVLGLWLVLALRAGHGRATHHHHEGP